jgi:ribosomal subunit interface protein
MDIRVTGRQVDVGDSFKTLVNDRLTQIADKYFSRALSASVTLGRQAHGYGFHVDCAMHVRQGVLLKAEGSGGEAPAAFDEAAEHIEKQLRRHKRRLKSHASQSPREFAASAANYIVLQDFAEDDAEAPAPANAEDHPVIVAETQTQVPTASVSDAVMLMDLRNAPALLFVNAKTNALNMVYRRADGHIGWVDPGAAKG